MVRAHSIKQMELVVQLVEHRFVEPVVAGSNPTQLPNAVVAQMVEAIDLESM